MPETLPEALIDRPGRANRRLGKAKRSLCGFGTPGVRSWLCWPTLRRGLIQGWRQRLRRNPCRNIGLRSFIDMPMASGMATAPVYRRNQTAVLVTLMTRAASGPPKLGSCQRPRVTPQQPL